MRASFPDTSLSTLQRDSYRNLIVTFSSISSIDSKNRRTNKCVSKMYSLQICRRVSISTIHSFLSLSLLFSHISFLDDL